VLASEIPVGHEIGLIIVAAIFIAFALASSFLVPRYNPDFPGPNGLGVFVIASVVLFGLMIAAVNFFG
jgi:Mg/Co/Ni transporter MgtE